MKIIKEDTLGQRIKAQRVRVGLTQEELADQMCVPKSTISAYENDRVDIKGSVLMELSKLLQTSPNYLLGHKEGKDAGASEIEMLFERIKDESTRKVLMAQLRAVAELNID